MDIRKKTVIILCAAISCLFLVLFILSEVVVLEGFAQVEHKDAEKDTNRVLVSLGNDINTLDAVAYDWASHADTRAFINDHPGTPWERLDSDTFERLQFNYILIADANGTVISGEGYDFDRHIHKPVPDLLTNLLAEGSSLRNALDPKYGLLGIVSSPEGPVLLAVRPVFSDMESGRVIGYLSMGRSLDATEVSRLTSMAQLPLEIYEYRATDLPQDFRNAMMSLAPTGSPFIQRNGNENLMVDAPTVLRTLDTNTLGTYSLIRDITGQPALIMKVTIVRDTFAQGQSTVLYFVLLVIFAGLIFGLVTLILLEKTVLSRVLSLSSRVNEIGKARDFSARLDTKGDDEISGLAGTVNEMLGELQSSEQQLKGSLVRSQEKYRIIFNSITDPVIVIKAGTDSSPGAILEANDSAGLVLGYTREELLKIPPGSISPGEDEVLPGLRSIATPGTVQFETVFRKKSGEEIPVEVNARYFDQGGERVILAIARDITDRKMAEGAIQRANRKLNLLNVVTFNDIQNATFVINGYINLMRETPLDPPQKQFLEKEAESIEKVLQSLTFAKSYQDLGVKTPRWQVLDHVFLMAISHLDLGSIQRNVNVKDLEIYADPLLEMVFFNLVENVIKHGKTATEISLSYDETPAGLRLIFEDNGAGIPAVIKESVFSREASGKTELGLFLVREILEITGITIAETGTEGQGARFEMVVPRKAYRFETRNE